MLRLIQGFGFAALAIVAAAVMAGCQQDPAASPSAPSAPVQPAATPVPTVAPSPMPVQPAVTPAPTVAPSPMPVQSTATPAPTLPPAPTPTPPATPAAEEVAAALLSSVIPWFNSPPDAAHRRAAELLTALWLRDPGIGYARRPGLLGGGRVDRRTKRKPWNSSKRRNRSSRKCCFNRLWPAICRIALT